MGSWAQQRAHSFIPGEHGKPLAIAQTSLGRGGGDKTLRCEVPLPWASGGPDPRSLKDPMGGEWECPRCVSLTRHPFAPVPMAAAGTRLAWTAPGTPLTPGGMPALSDSLAQEPSGPEPEWPWSASLGGWHPRPLWVCASLEVGLESQPRREAFSNAWTAKQINK